MVGRILDEPAIAELAAAYNKTPAQIVLRWDLQHAVVTIPKSVRAERIAENADIFDFELSADDMAKLDGLNRDQRIGPHRTIFNKRKAASRTGEAAFARFTQARSSQLLAHRLKLRRHRGALVAAVVDAQRGGYALRAPRERRFVQPAGDREQVVELTLDQGAHRGHLEANRLGGLIQQPVQIGDVSTDACRGGAERDDGYFHNGHRKASLLKGMLPL